MHKKMITLILVIIELLFLDYTCVSAMTNIDTTNNYKIIIEDDANLLTETEEQKLKVTMSALTEYGNVMFKTTNITTNYKPLKYIRNYYYSTLANQKGVAFYIDMKQRQLCVCATGRS